MDELIIPKGTIVKYNGIPFMLTEDAKVSGLKENLALAERLAVTPKTSESGK